MNRRHAAILILLCWLGALSWLLGRRSLGPSQQDDATRWPIPPGSAYHAIRLGERQHGLASLTIDTVVEGLRITELVTVDLPPVQPGQLRRTTHRVQSLYTRNLHLLRWQSDLLTEQGRSAGTGSVFGDSLLVVTVATPGEPVDTLTVALARSIVLPSAVPLLAMSRGLPRPGSRLVVETYDPLAQELREERLTVAAESVFTVPDSADFNRNLRRWQVAHSDTVRGWRLDATIQGLPVSRWVDGTGMTLGGGHVLGARFERSAFEVVSSNFRAAPPAPWETGSTTPRYQASGGSPYAGGSLTVLGRLAPDLPLPPGLPALEGGWQVRTGDTIRVLPLPANPADSGATPSPMAEPLLVAGADVTRQAARIAGSESRPEQVVRRMRDWVRNTITLRAGPGGRSAGAILASRHGSAAERVTLVVALARARQLEARAAWGLVRVGAGWELRPWAEIRTGTWTPVDPGLPGPVSRPDRIRLAFGSEPRLLDLALRAGRLRLAMLEASE